MTFSVHKPLGLKRGWGWETAAEYDPPMPGPVAGKGYPVFFVEFDGFTFQFASLHELDVCVEVLGKKALPNNHDKWFAKLPGEVLPWRYREPAVAFLVECREHFESELTQ